MSSEELIDDLKTEAKRLRRTLETLPSNQEHLRESYVARLQETESEMLALELSAADELESQAPIDDAVRPQSHIRYLEMVQERFRRQAEIYGDLTIESRRPQSKKLLTAAGARFMDLHHQVYSGFGDSFESDARASVRVDTFDELFATIVAERPRLALIGDPGSGKSTTLARLAYEYAVRAFDDPSRPIPLFLDLARALPETSFQQMVESAEEQAFGGDARDRRHIVALIDGLNETSQAMVAEIVEWIHNYQQTGVIVACRKIDYIDRVLPLRRVDILPLDVRQIRAFIQQFLVEDGDCEELFWGLAGSEAAALWRWFKANSELPTFENFWHGEIGQTYSYEAERTAVRRLQAAVRNSTALPGLMEVVKNPLFLYLSILIFGIHDELPESRGDLLGQFVATMIAQRRWSGSGVEDREYGDRATRIQENHNTELFEELAFEVTRQGFGTGFSSSWMKEFLLPIAGDTVVEEFFEGAKRSAILDWTPGAPPIVKFRHQLIQEYLASRRLGREALSGASAQGFWPDDSWWEATPWDEVALFLAESLDDATQVIDWIAEVNPSLAFRCASTPGVSCDSQALGRLLDPPSGARVCPVARAEWGRRQNDGGDPRPGVRTDAAGLPDISWVRVPPGEYVIGGDESLQSLGLFVPEVEVIVPHHYLIARYPVTYAQFGAFVDRGYREDRHWTETGLQWRGNQVQPRLWESLEYNLANHPVVGVTWFEAVAFCRWLTEARYGDSGWWEISLPTEAEWEIACRYPGDRRYPWGDVYVPGTANIDETFQDAIVGPYSLRRATAVGMYEAGRSELGLYDMWGNVWEWCLSKWDVEYVFPEDVSLEGSQHRGVRGNSWYNSARFAPSAHDALDPDFGVKDTGFRLVARKRIHASG